MSRYLDRPSATDADRELRAELVGRAAKLVPQLAATAQRSEDERQALAENIEAIREAGLLSLMRPKRYGGLQTDIRTKLEVSRELARGCGSTAWSVSLMNVCTWFAALWPEQAQDEIWRDSRENRVAGSLSLYGTASPVDGGYRVTGRWPFASGSGHAQWSVLGTVTEQAAGPPAIGLVLIPRREVTIEDSWHVVGMSGTGSNTVVADEVFVPAHRYQPMQEIMDGEYGTPFTGEVLYRSAFVPVAALILAGPLLGMAQAALDLVLEKVPGRAATATFFDRQSDVPGVQSDLAGAAVLVEGAHLHAYLAAAEIDQNAYDGVYPDMLGRAKARMDTAVAVKYAREAIRLLLGVHGAASFATGSPMQRIWRNAEAGSTHTILRPEINSQLYGQHLLGIEGGVTGVL